MIAVVAQATPAPAPTPAPCDAIAAIVSRPTVTNAACTVPQHRVEIEAGYQNTNAASGVTVSYPQIAVRIGTDVPNLEVQVSPPQVQRTSAGGLVTGLTDAGMGVKYLLHQSSASVASVQVSATAPTGSAAFSAGASTLTYAAQGTLAFGPVFSLAGGVQEALLAAGGARYASFVPTLVLGAGLPHATSLYAEIAQFSHALGDGSPTRTQYITGVSRGLSPRLQIDAEYGWSPTVATGRYRYVGVGLGCEF